MSGGLDFSFGFKGEGAEEVSRSGDHLRLLVAGLFSLENEFQIRKVSWENFDDIIGNLSIELPIQIDETKTIMLEIDEIDDLHPDEIYDNCSYFAQLRQLKKRLRSPDSFPQAAKELGLYEEPTTGKPISAGGDSLSELLGGAPSTDVEESSSTKTNQFIESLVRPYIIPNTDPKVDVCCNYVDELICASMKTILNDPNFKKIEASWRSLDLLIKSVESESNVQISLLNMPNASITNNVDQLTAVIKKNINSQGELDYFLLLEPFNQMEDLNAFSKAISNFEFYSFVNMSPELVGLTNYYASSDSDDWTSELTAQDEWNDFRARVSAKLTVSINRFLVRYPYGHQFDELDRFNFEELNSQSKHDNFLWGQVSVLSVYQLLREFEQTMKVSLPSGEKQINEMKCYHSKNGLGEVETLSPVEHWLSDKAVNVLFNLGLSVAQGMKSTDKVRLFLQTINN